MGNSMKSKGYGVCMGVELCMEDIRLIDNFYIRAKHPRCHTRDLVVEDLGYTITYWGLLMMSFMVKGKSITL